MNGEKRSSRDPCNVVAEFVRSFVATLLDAICRSIQTRYRTQPYSTEPLGASCTAAHHFCTHCAAAHRRAKLSRLSCTPVVALALAFNELNTQSRRQRRVRQTCRLLYYQSRKVCKFQLQSEVKNSKVFDFQKLKFKSAKLFF